MSKKLHPSDMNVVEFFDAVMDNWAIYPPTLTGGECQKPISEVVSRLVLKNGKPVETLVRTGIGEGGKKSFVDQLTFVIHRSTCSNLLGDRYDIDTDDETNLDYADCARVMSYYLESIFGFGITADRKKGANFYSQSFQLGDNKISYGILAIGGNKQTLCVELTATGLGAAKPGWEHRLNQFAASDKVVDFRLTRLDIARDFFEGEYSIEDALNAYYAGGFNLSVTTPQLRKEGADWWNEGLNKGRTVYFGSRQSSRLVRVYEKGKQLGDKTSLWVRVEIEYRSRDLVLNMDMILNPGDYMAQYPAFQRPEFFTEQAKQAESKKRTIQNSIEHYIKYLRIQGSKAVKMLVEHGKTAEEILNVFDPDAKVPDKVHPGRYFCQLLGIDYLHREPGISLT